MRAHKRECVDTLIDAVHGRITPFLTQGIPMKARRFLIRPFPQFQAWGCSPPLASLALHRAKHNNATRGVAGERRQVPSRFLRPAGECHSQARGAAAIPSTKNRPPIGQQKRIPQNELQQRTTISLAQWSVGFMHNIIVEVLLALRRPFPVGPTRT
jgi:hypothetical protein